MNLSTLQILTFKDATPKEFVLFWERFYFDKDEDFYKQNIHAPLTKDRIADWFKWKNGMKLSAKKAESVRRYFGVEEPISQGANSPTERAYLLKPGGAIWRIFRLHLQYPSIYPIYDQHVYRAMAFLLKLPKPEIPDHNPTKVGSYLDEYLPFFAQFAECEHRLVDRALWTYGKFLLLNARAQVS